MVDFSSAATFAPLVADTALWFNRRRRIAVAICASGNYLAGTVWSPVLQHFFDTVGWRATYVGVGLFCALTIIPLAFFLRLRPPAHAPATFEEGPIREVGVGRRPTSIAFGEDAVWVANLEDDTVTRIDPDTHSTFTIPVDDAPVAVAVGAGSVWVASAGARSVSRIDPARNEVVATIGTSNPPAGIVVAGGSVWVTVQAP